MEFTFNFQVHKPKEKTKVKKVSNIYERNVEGVIEINLEGYFYIIIHNTEYRLSNKSYDCRGKLTVYSKQVINNKFIKKITLNKVSKNYSCYLPFKAGNIVIGNLIREDGNIKFDILRFNNFNPDLIVKSKEAQKYFIENYEKIKDLI